MYTLKVKSTIVNWSLKMMKYWGEPPENLLEEGFELIHNDDHCVGLIALVKTQMG